MHKIKNLKLLILGFSVGIFSASLGVGGGVVLVPALMFFFDYDIKKAVGTSLAAMASISFVGIIAHYFINSGNIKLLAALFIAAGSVIGAKFGVNLAVKISSKNLSRLFALLLLFTGLELTGIINVAAWEVAKNIAYPLLIIMGALTGFASALFGIGGGVIMVPALNLLWGLSMHEAVATSLAVVLPTAIAGTLFHEKYNNIDKEAAFYLIPLALIGAVFGAFAANSIPQNALKVIFGILIILSSIKIFFQKY